jgi:DME family drug/metabolite transporter
MYGYASALVAAFAFSLNAPLAYAAAKRGVSSTALVGLRNAVALTLLLPFADFRISHSALFAVLTSALLGPGLGDYAYFKAMQQGGVATAVTLGYTYIFTAQFFSIAMGLEGFKISVAVGAGLAFIGIMIALGGRPKGPGVLYGAVASLAWGLASALLGAAAKEATPYTIAVVRSAVLAPLFFALPDGRRISTSGLPYAVLSGVVGLAFGSLAFIYAISQIQVSATVVATSLTPILSQILDRAINKSHLSTKYILGASLVALGIVATMMNN